MRIVGLLLLFGLIVSTLSASFVAASGADPSYQNGFARHAAESARPQDWVGLVGFWLPTLGPTGVTLRDWSGYGNDGTLTLMVPATDWILDGEQGYVLDFDGVNDSVNVANEPFFDFERTDPLSIAVLVRNNVSEFTSVLSKENAGLRGYSILGLDSGGGIGYVLHVTNTETSNALETRSTVDSPLNTWHWVVSTYDGSSSVSGLLLYVDGVDVSAPNTDNLSATILNDVDFRIGRHESLSDPPSLNGEIAQVRIYTKVLPPSQVVAISNDSLGIVRLADPSNVHSIQAAIATPQVIIIGWAVPEWLAVIITNLGLARIGG